jgi:hypothetical protein
MENASQKPLVLGRVDVAQERLYREGKKGHLELGGTTATPDEFTRDLARPFADIEEKNLSGHTTSETFTITHYAYISSSHFQSDGHVARIRAASTSPTFDETVACRTTGAVQLRLLSHRIASCSSQISWLATDLGTLLAPFH